MVAAIEYLDNFEIGLCLRINRFGRKEGVRRFFSIVSRLGDGGIWVFAGLLIYFLQGSGAVPEIVRMALTVVTGIFIYKALKQYLVRERHFINHSAIQCGIAPLDQYSFLSGHTLHAVSFTVMLAHIEPMSLLVSMPFTALIAASRVVLGLHYPSDVIVGAMIAACLGWISAAY